MSDRVVRRALIIAFALALSAISLRLAWPQAISNPSNPTSNPNQINVTNGYLYLNKIHYAGTWSSTVSYNSEDVVFYSGAAYISLQVANLNQNPASASLYWVVIPGSGGGGGSSVWGSITGTLSAQTDLSFALAGKQASLGFTPLNAASNLSDLGSAVTARTNLGLAAVASTGSASDLGTGTLPHARLPTLLSGDIPNNAANTSGVAGTATALAATPTLCTTGQAPTGVLASGNATGCAALGGATPISGVGEAPVFVNHCAYCLAQGGVGSPNRGQAWQFTPTNSITVETIALMSGANTSGAESTIGIYSDSSGTCASLIAQATPQSTAVAAGTLLYFALTTNPTLNAGTTYWLVYASDTAAGATYFGNGTDNATILNQPGHARVGYITSASTGSGGSLSLLGTCGSLTANGSSLPLAVLLP